MLPPDQGEGQNWTLPIDATLLTSGSLASYSNRRHEGDASRGQNYKLCLDLDGSESDDLGPGNVLSFSPLGLF